VCRLAPAHGPSVAADPLPSVRNAETCRHGIPMLIRWPAKLDDCSPLNSPDGGSGLISPGVRLQLPLIFLWRIYNAISRVVFFYLVPCQLPTDEAASHVLMWVNVVHWSIDSPEMSLAIPTASCRMRKSSLEDGRSKVACLA